MAASELAHAKGKSKSKNLKRLAALGLCGMLAGTAAAAIPEGVAQSPTDVAVGTGSEAKGTYSTAYGETAKANTVFATALGSSAQAQGQSAIAVGRSPNATGNYAISIGDTSVSSGDSAVVVGAVAKGAGARAVAVGREANAQSDDTVAVGGKAAAATNAVVVGKEASVRAATASDLPSGITAAQTGATAGTGSVAVGANAKAYGTNATTIGQSSNALGQNSLAGGQAAKAYGKSSVALGDGALASNDAAAAVGTSAQATAGGTAALGYAANASGFGAVAVGRQAAASANAAAAFGDSAAAGARSLAGGAAANAKTAGDIALGHGASAEGRTTSAATFDANGIRAETYGPAMAQGAYAAAAGRNAIAIGNNARARGSTADGTVNDLIAIGAGSTASGNRAVAVGYKATAGASGQVAVGTSSGDEKSAQAVFVGQAAGSGNRSAAGNTYGIAIGNNAGINMAGGTENVAIGNSAGVEVNGNTNYALGSRAGGKVSGSDNYALGIEAGREVTGSQNAAYGYRSGQNVSGSGNNAFGYRAGLAVQGGSNSAFGFSAGINVVGDRNLAFGASAGQFVGAAGATANNNIAIGAEANTFASGSELKTSDNTAVGRSSRATGGGSIAVGQDASAAGANAAALGTASQAAATGALALGNASSADKENAVALGAGSTTAAPATSETAATVNGISYNGFAGSAPAAGDLVSVGSAATQRQIKHVAAGRIAADSTDAVNVSQLKALADARSKVAGSGLASVSSATDSAGATTYTVNVAQAAAPTVTRGNVAVAAADAGKVMTAGDVAAAINNSEKTSSVVAGSTAVSVSAGSEDAAGNTQYTVDLGTAAKASLGKADSALQNIRSGSPNLSVAKNGDTVTVGMSTTPAFTSVTTGDTVLNSGGLTIAPAGKTPVVLNSDGLNNGGNKITNVAAGNISAASTDAVNGSQLYALGEKPLTFTGDSGSVRRKLGETLAVKGDGTYVSTKAENGGVNISVSENAVRDTARKAVDVKGEGVITVTPSQDNTAHTTTYTVKYDGGKAAAATDIAYTANGGTARKTSLAKGFNFSNGANTTAEVGADGIVKFNAVTGSIATTGGKAAVAAADAGKLATAGDVAEAVNNAAWKVTAKADGGELESGASVESVKAGDQVGLQVGKNLKLKQNGKNFTYLLNDTLTGLNSASFGGSAGQPSAMIDGSGVRITPAGGGKAVSLTDKGLDNGGQTIANVASGGSTETNAANIGDVKKAAAAKNTVSAGDANVTVTPKAFSDGHTDYAVKLADKVSLGKGKVSLDGTGGDISAANSIKAGNTITAGQGANAVAIDGTKAEVKAGKVTVNGKDGHITGLANTTWVSGQTAPVSGRAATEDQLKAVDNQVAQNKTDIAKLSGNIGQGLNFAGNTGSVNKKLGSTVNIVGEGTKADSRYSGENVKTMVDANGNLVVKTDKDLKAESLTLAKDGKTGVAITTDNGAGNISLNGAKTDIAAAKGAAVLGGSAQADRIRYTGSDGTPREAATMDDGMRYGGDNLAFDGTIDKKLNQRLDIVGGADKAKLSDNNIGVNKDSQGRLKVQLSKELNGLSSASFADGSGNTAVVNGAGSTVKDSAGNQTAVGAGGVSITPASGNAVSLGGGGLDNGGNKITNVAAGEKATDAVNVGQLNAKLGAITEAANLNFNALEHKIDNVGETANAGVAGAIAQGSIPQVTRPGASSLGVGSGYYGGQSALAVGMSSMSDGGNWIVKGNISVNTKGRVGAGAGALYQW